MWGEILCRGTLTEKFVSFDGAILDDELWVADGVHLSSMLIDAGAICGFN